MLWQLILVDAWASKSIDISLELEMFLAFVYSASSGISVEPVAEEHLCSLSIMLCHYIHANQGVTID